MADLEQLKQSLARRVEKVKNLGDGEETKRQKKREFAEIGKLRKKIALAESEGESSHHLKKRQQESSSNQEPKKKKKSDSDTSINVEGSEKRDVDANYDRDGQEGKSENKKSSKKSNKGVLKSMNNKLSLLSTRKQFKQAHKSFLSLAKRGISGNVHTFSIMINCAVRCGNLEEACKYYEEMKSLGISPNVITVTTLLKGYCEAGDIGKAKQLLDTECEGGLIPNIRTVNTMLRGCVRTGDTDVAVAIFNQLVDWKLETDETSMAAMSGIFCRVLRVEDAHRLISSIQSAIPEAWVDIALSYALSEQWAKCEEALNQAEEALHQAEAENTHSIEKKRLSEASDEFGNKLNDSEVRKSVKMFNTHKQGELRKIVEDVRQHCTTALTQANQGASGGAGGGKKKREPYWSVLSRVIPLTFDQTSSSSSVLAGQTLSNLVSQFGLDLAVDMSSSMKQQTARMQEISSRLDGVFDNDGHIDFDHGVFKSITTGGGGGDDQASAATSEVETESTLVKLEICSGHGEWVVEQAKADPTSKWVALELRHDRVFQTVARMFLENVDNLSVIGPNDARRVLEERIAPSSIDCIFINHPEPPERTGGSDDSEGSHLLDDNFFGTMCRVLRSEGTITIVTDNQPYALSLAKSAQGRNDLENAPLLDRMHSQALMTTVGDKIDVYVGRPGAECGHVSSSSSSFFDRMWKHGKKNKRYTLFLRKV